MVLVLGLITGIVSGSHLLTKFNQLGGPVADRVNFSAPILDNKQAVKLPTVNYVHYLIEGISCHISRLSAHATMPAFPTSPCQFIYQIRDLFKNIIYSRARRGISASSEISSLSLS